MSDQDEQDPLAAAHLDTLAVRSGIHRTQEGEHSEPIFATSSYVFENAEHAAARFSGESAGNVYSRYTNPSVRSFEERLAALEGAEAAVGTASGMSAILSICMAFLKAGDHVVCSRDVFGTSVNLFSRYMEKFGVAVTFVPLLDTCLVGRTAARDLKPPCFFWRRHPTPCVKLPIYRLWLSWRKSMGRYSLSITAFAHPHCSDLWHWARISWCIQRQSILTGRGVASAVLWWGAPI